MVIMAVDHVIYFLGRFHPAEFWNVAPPVFPNAGFEIIRFITHVCAPGFVLFAGVSLSLGHAGARNRGESAAELRRKTLIRAGLLFVVVQLVLESLAWGLGAVGGRGVPMNDIVIPGSPATGPFAYFGVIYAIAASLAVCAVLLSACDRTILGIAVIAILASPVALLFAPEADKAIHPLAGPILYPGESIVYTAYPVLPWAGVMLLGLLIGRGLSRGQDPRNLLLPGIGSVAAGVAFRFVVPFGESTPLSDLWSFFDLSKYPPSLAFLGITVGLNLIVLALFDRFLPAPHGDAHLPRPLREFGREPLLFYLAHLYLYGLLCFLIVFPNQLAPLVAVWVLSFVPLYALVRWYRSLRAAGKLPRLLRRL